MPEVLEEGADIVNLIREAEQFIERRNPEGLPLAKRAMDLAERSGNPHYLAYARYIFAFHHCLVANDYDKAIEICEGVLKTFPLEEIKDVSYKIFMTLGNAYQLKGEVFSAQENYMRGMRLLESRNEAGVTEKSFLASFYYNVSLLLGSSALEINAEEYLKKAIEIYTELGLDFKLSKSLVAYAGIFERKTEFHEAIKVLFRALEIDTGIKDGYSIALDKANLGILHLRIDEFETAFKYLNQALEYYEKNKMKYEISMVKINLGETLFATGKQHEGIAELLEAEELFAELDNKRELSHCHELLSKFFMKMGNYKPALEYQIKYTDSLKYFFDAEKTNALTRAKKEFESEQKEKETVLLREKNEEIKRYVHRLEISNNELKQFAHVASHDLREPQRMITSYMGLLKKTLKGNISEQQNEFITYAVDGSKRMEMLIVDLLRLAKVDANPKTETVKLQSVAEEIMLNLDALLKEKNAMIVTSDLPVVKADRTQMLQLFQNIIGNGIKYNESESPLVQVKGKTSGDKVEITISDNGIGIHESYREKIFQIFQRVETSKKYSGSGIGLAICKKIVEGMNGKISVEDNPKGGTIFRITLPAKLVM